ncbi:SDR family NAD(P)-dependent oxidoreductase [Novosphingobium taihuense]|uniref:NAD(P)-dependent dehydrogenase (Short-subunit alcohol dehydrogenase family) n=1 Tax=Novosphingobium taihuense TaxID=260085 RepID=A0A7W7EUF2_9SPHN|nr:SDR family NAD(P)-dependent oxidoreductase [Novosphingobium taihuense]MBB4614282.1 NAD(P)-dependent dehydrogenase (short-subunit alcohol dehydrogenase family) [Novosphingobium taihuense]TWH87129.1 NAD(P)-dependent dehydrogenase (short-subunit alcohol dehydrogenase family) [Novosphingobium taihuense]
MSRAELRYDGRVAIVTGAGSGLGRDYALNLAKRGASVVVNDLGVDTRGRQAAEGSESSAQAVVREIESAGGKAVACHESCATRAGGAAIVQAALDAFGRVDILIHNAGFLRNGPFESLTDEQIHSIMDVHLLAAFYVGQPAFAAMKQNGYGRILLTSSASAFFGMPWQTNYAAAKLGLAGLVNALSLEGQAHGINVNALLPTGSGRLGKGDSDMDWPDGLMASVPAGMELIAPQMRNEFVTPMVMWLVNERSKTTHGYYSATAGRFSRIFIGAARGWLSDAMNPPMPEDIEEHMAEIDDISRYDIPLKVFDEFEPIVAAQRALLEGKGD